MLALLLQDHVQEHGEHLAEEAAEKFDAGKTIIEHVSNSGLDHPLIHLPKILGIDFSVTKHVFMLWLVAAFVFVVVTLTVRTYLKKDRLVPSGFMGVLEALVEYVRDTIARPNVGRKWVNTWTPLLLTFFVFIFCANAIGLIPLFDVIGLLDHWVLHTADGSFVKQVIHGGTTATAQFQRHGGARDRSPSARSSSPARRAHGFVQHWKNIVPHGLAWPLYILLIPIEVMGMFVKPFALTMRLAANMTGGHIAILAILSFVFLFTELFGQAMAGIGVGLVVSVPLAVGISALEIIVVLVQAYVFTLLSAVFIGMAINVHH